MPDGTRYSRTLATKLDAEAWLAAERALIDREAWTPPRARRAAHEKRVAAAATNTVAAFAERYLAERGLRPTAMAIYQHATLDRGQAAGRRHRRQLHPVGWDARPVVTWELGSASGRWGARWFRSIRRSSKPADLCLVKAF